MDLAEILKSIGDERKQMAARLIVLARAARILKKLRAPMHHAKVSLSPSVAQNRIRGRKAWKTRLKNQREKLSILRAKRAA